MTENFKALRAEFITIKNKGLIKSLRKGTTGAGFTFETLLNKKEDASFLPDYKGIELKTKLGYSKSPLTLFNCIPKRNKKSAINYILENYSWKTSENINIFSYEVGCSKNDKKYNFSFKLEIDYLAKQIVMKSYKDNIFYENVCYWDFKDLEKKLNIKLKYLAIVLAYPYKVDGDLYYKYLKMTMYKLKGFFEFLELIKNGKINIHFYMKKNKENVIDNHGVSFRINNNNIEDLFRKLYF